MVAKAPCSNGLRLIAGRANPDLAKEIASILNVPLCDIRISTFANSETHVQIEESVRGKDVFIVQPTCLPANENLMELLVIIDACRRASARQITAVVPYFGYGRQDHKSTGREPVTAKMVADILTTVGVNRVVSVDLHSPQIQGFFNVPMDHLTAVPTLAGYLRKKEFKDAVIVAPDAGRVKMAEKYTDILQIPMAVMTKRRKGIGGNELEFYDVVGNIAGKTAIVIDDEISAGSIIQEVETLFKAGTSEVYLSITHPILLSAAVESLRASPIKELIVTNTVSVPQEKLAGGKVKVLSIAPLLSKVVLAIHDNDSVSQIFREEKLVFPV
jgi:ribose-phosphate pyrophosphokinase